MAVKRCHNCGQKLTDDRMYCANCGTANNFEDEKMTKEKTIKTDGKEKSRVAAALLGIFLGGLGLHNFYLGYTGKGLAQILLSTIGWVILVGPIIANVWGFIEGILILSGSIREDASGNELIG